MEMEPHVVVVTRNATSRVASLLREAGYLVTKRMPELAGDHLTAEALIVDLRLFDLVQWLERQKDHDRILIVTPPATILKDIPARVLRTADVENDLVSTVDRMVANRRIAAHRREQITRIAQLAGVSEASYSPLTNFFGAMAR